MGSACSTQHGPVDEYDTRNKKKVISRARHSLTVSNHSDGLDASVRFVTRKTPERAREQNGDKTNESDLSNDQLLDGSADATRCNPFALKQDRVASNGQTTFKPPLLGNSSTMDELLLGRKLGSGTYGTVYSAHFTGMNGFLQEKKIAAKILKVPKQEAERDRLLLDFENEVRILSRVQHPRILLFLGCINQAPNDYVIMTEILAGNVCQVLKKTKETGKAISWDISTQIMLDVSEAMDFLHSCDPPIIHRDLKSENVLLTTDWRAKVADLGLSREIVSHKAGHYTVCGTPCWVAPEIFRGENYGWQVDVYSFAVVVWEILAGVKPFRGVSLLDLPDLVARRCQRPEIPQKTPRDLKLLMAAMWADNALSRPDFCRIQIALHRIRGEIPDLEKAMVLKSGPNKSNESRIRDNNNNQNHNNNHEYSNDSSFSGSFGSFGSFGSEKVVKRDKNGNVINQLSVKTNSRSVKDNDNFIYKSHAGGPHVSRQNTSPQPIKSMFGQGLREIPIPTNGGGAGKGEVPIELQRVDQRQPERTELGGG